MAGGIALASLFSVPILAQAPPMVDGDCAEYSALHAQNIGISKEVGLHIFQDKYFVWFCYTYPDGSFGTADLKMKTKTIPNGLNLHVSAQLGEWPMDKPELAPKNPESEMWWNHNGWTANPVWINGMDRSGAQARYRFKNAKAREIQISKRRFGIGEWLFSLEIRSIKGSDGKTFDLTFPTVGEYKLKVK